MDSNEHAAEAQHALEVLNPLGADTRDMTPHDMRERQELALWAQTKATLAVAEELRALREQGVRQTVFQPAPGPTGGFPENPPRATGGQQ